MVAVVHRMAAFLRLSPSPQTENVMLRGRGELRGQVELSFLVCGSPGRKSVLNFPGGLSAITSVLKGEVEVGAEESDVRGVL